MIAGAGLAGQPVAWAMEMAWRIRKRGTRKVGIRLSGSTVIGSMEAALGLMMGAVMPRVTAETRSRMPRNCQVIKAAR